MKNNIEDNVKRYLIATFLLVSSTILNGYILSILWKWFVMPIFNVSELTTPQAIGIAMTANFLSKSKNYNSTNDKKITMTDLVLLYLLPILTLVTGWIVVQFA